MITIENIWIENDRKVGLKVRWNDWGWRFKYFTIEGVDNSGKNLIGKLDNGETFHYPRNSSGWKVYHPGDEEISKAV